MADQESQPEFVAASAWKLFVPSRAPVFPGNASERRAYHVGDVAEREVAAAAWPGTMS